MLMILEVADVVAIEDDLSGSVPRRGSEQERASYEVLSTQAAICRALGEPKRLAILHELRHGARSVGELALALDCRMPNMSQHLSTLSAAGLVSGRRRGSTVLYELVEPGILDACDVVAQIVTNRMPDRPVLLGDSPAQDGHPATSDRKTTSDQKTTSER